MNKLSNKFGRLWLAAALLLLISTPPARSAITDGVVAYWNFDNADFKDAVGLNGVKFDGTANGSAPITFEAGKAGFGQAMQLNGTDQWVEITGGDPDDLAFAGESMSVSVWFKVGAFDKSWQALVAKGEGGNWRIHRRAAEQGMAYTGGPSGDTPAGTPVSDGQWHHLVAITDKDAAIFGTALYIDGVLDAQLAAPQVLTANGLRMAIGDNPGARARYWNGTVDDVAIWNRVLTDAEIASLYFSGAGKPLSSFLGPHVDTIVTAKGASEPDNVQVQIIDDGTAVFDPNAAANLNVKVDGTALPPTSKSKSGTVSLMNFKKQFYTSTSQVQVYVEAKDTNGKWTTNQLTFTIPTYPTIPSGYKLAAPATTPGMVAAQIYQIDFARTPSSDENSVASAEQQLARGFPVAGGTPHPNVAAQASDNTVSVVNWARFNDLTGDYNINATPANGPDNFNDARPTNAPVPNVTIPGLPGTGSDQGHGGTDAGSAWDNIVVETTAYMRLTRGAYQMGVNSDDGFKVTTSPAAEDPFGLLLGQFSGLRGAANTTFWFVVLEDGDYPVRLLWWQGAGGGNVEWFVTDRNTGSRVLVNGAGSPITTFRQGSGRAHVKSILPANGFDGVEPNSPIKIVLVDGSTTVVNGSISLTVDGSPVTPTISSGATTTVSYNAPSSFGDSRHTGRLVWGESTTPQTMHTNDFSFLIRVQSPDDLPSYTAGSFWIEFEDFDATGDPGFAAALALANTMPYAGGAFADIGAKEGVDYNNGDAAGDGNVYRTEFDSAGTVDPNTGGPENEVSMYNNLGGRYGARRAGGFDLSVNFAIGWAGSANEWNNYTRVISNGLYRVLGALSYGGDTNPGRLTGDLHEVTSGFGTSNQVTKLIGSFNGPGTGGWGTDALVPLNGADGNPATFKIKKFPGATTLRFYSVSGDYDWFVLVPATGVTPSITSVTPPLEHTVYRNTTITWTIEDFSTAVQTNSITLSFGGVNVTPQLVITKPATDLTTVSYTPAQLLDAAASYPYALVFRDNGTPQTSKTNSGTVVTHYLPRTAVDGAFAIEAEDFNYNGGQSSNVVNTMPYPGGAYTNLGAVVGIDYQRANEPSGDIYRIGEAPNVPMGGNTGTTAEQPGTVPDITRAGWNITQNFSLGWAGGNQWVNYTRQIPANTYQIWAAMSYGGAGPNLLQGNLLRVTSGATTTTQTTASLGVFRGPGTGGWGANALVPLRESPTNSAIKTVQLSGETTLRFENVSGDFDYLMLIPVGPSGPTFNSPVLSGSTLTITWSGTGLTLEQATALTGSAADWSAVPGSPTSPFTVNVGTTARTFYRLRGAGP